MTGIKNEAVVISQTCKQIGHGTAEYNICIPASSIPPGGSGLTGIRPQYYYGMIDLFNSEAAQLALGLRSGY